MAAALDPFWETNKVYCIVLYLIILCILITSMNQLGWLSSEQRRSAEIDSIFIHKKKNERLWTGKPTCKR